MLGAAAGEQEAAGQSCGIGSSKVQCVPEAGKSIGKPRPARLCWLWAIITQGRVCTIDRHLAKANAPALVMAERLR